MQKSKQKLDKNMFQERKKKPMKHLSLLRKKLTQSIKFGMRMK